MRKVPEGQFEVSLSPVFTEVYLKSALLLSQAGENMLICKQVTGVIEPST